MHNMSDDLQHQSQHQQQHAQQQQQQQHQQQHQQAQQTQSKRLQHQHHHHHHTESLQQQQQQQHKMCKDNVIATNGSAITATRASPVTAATPHTHSHSQTPSQSQPTTTSSSMAGVGGGAGVMASASTAAATAATTPTTTAPTTRKTLPHELRNSEYVSRLMAATPPYLYSAPVGPNNFFFSDMLRSLVQARNNENVRNLQLQQSIIARRSRKRSWSAQHRPAAAAAAYMEHLRDGGAKATPLAAMPTMATLPAQQLTLAQRHQHQLHQQQQQHDNGGTGTGSGNGIEKPLELTNKTVYFHGAASKYRKLEAEEPNVEAEPCDKKLSVIDSPTAVAPADCGNQSSADGAAGDGVQDTPPAASLPPQDLVLPPPPIWYPPHLYPPYGIDPLHFFIDLRVSGHIYDRKKENLSPLATASAENSNNNSNNNNDSTAASLPGAALPLQLPQQKYRHGSAFSVPVPRGAHERKLSGGMGVGLGAAGAGVGGGVGGIGGCGGGVGGAAAAAAAINLSSKFEHYAKYYDFGDDKDKEKENQPTMLHHQPPAMAANYMLQQLPRLYSQFAAGQAVAAVAHAANAAVAVGDGYGDVDAEADVEADGEGDVDNKSEPDCDADGCDDSDVDGNGGGGGGGGSSGDVDAIGGHCAGGVGERDIDVEFIDSIQRSIKYHRRGFDTGAGGCGGGGGADSSRCSSADESSITQID